MLSQPQPQIHYYYNTPYPPSGPLVSLAPYSSPTTSHYSNDTPSPLNFSAPPASGLKAHHNKFLECSGSPTIDDPAPRLSKPRSIKGEVPSRRIRIAHPYARLFAKKDETKRRKIWNHVLEKLIFSPYELSTVGAPQRRTIYITSLEAHIDRLHSQLEELGFWPVSNENLEPFKGLNSKTAKSMVAGLQYDASISRLKLLELERANDDLQKILLNFPSGT